MLTRSAFVFSLELLKDNEINMRERSIFDGDLPGIHNPLLGPDPRLSTPPTIPTTTPARPVTKLPATTTPARPVTTLPAATTPAPTEDDYGDITEQPGKTIEALSREELAAQEVAALAEYQADLQPQAIAGTICDALQAQLPPRILTMKELLALEAREAFDDIRNEDGDYF
jgi:hypothetical protein